MSPEDLTLPSREELEQRIVAVREELEDLMAERSLTLRGTGVHIGGKRAQEMREEFEQDEAQLQAKLKELRARLG